MSWSAIVSSVMSGTPKQSISVFSHTVVTSSPSVTFQEVKAFYSLSQLSKQSDSRREFLFLSGIPSFLWRWDLKMWLIFSPKNIGMSKTGFILWNQFQSKCDILDTYLFISTFQTKSVNYLYISGIFRFCPVSINTPRHQSVNQHTKTPRKYKHNPTIR